jgi:ribosomal protein S18 acetylase RimI-like enzyme
VITMAEGHKLAFKGGEVELAPVEQDDLQPLVQLTRKLMEPLLRTGFGFQWDLRLERALMQDLMRKPVVLVIRRSGEIIGYASLDPQRPRAKLHGLMLEPAHQGLGIGSAVLALVEERSAGLRCRDIVTAVQPNNKQGLAFLKARGYAEAGLDGANILMRKALPNLQ